MIIITRIGDRLVDEIAVGIACCTYVLRACRVDIIFMSYADIHLLYLLYVLRALSSHEKPAICYLSVDVSLIVDLGCWLIDRLR